MNSSTQALARPDLVGAALAEALGDPAWRACTARLVSGGKSNLTYELTSAAGRVVLRRPPSGDLLPSAHDMAREARVQNALSGTDVPVARILLTDDGDLLGVPCYVMTWMPGHIIGEHLPPGYAASPGERAKIADALVDTLVSLHTVDPQAVGLADFGRADGFLDRQLRRWRDQWQRTRTREVPEVDSLADRLARAVPTNSRMAIVHGDYRLDNCVLDPSDPGRVVAVLDWEMSTLGDPMTDVGLLLFYWREPGERPPLLTPSVTSRPGFPGRQHLAERYASRAGVELRDLPWYVGYAHWKFAVIAQGIAVRSAADTMGGQDFGDLDDEVARIAREGLASMEE